VGTGRRCAKEVSVREIEWAEATVRGSHCAKESADIDSVA
jgi:hypothetical protein